MNGYIEIEVNSDPFLSEATDVDDTAIHCSSNDEGNFEPYDVISDHVISKSLNCGSTYCMPSVQLAFIYDFIYTEI
jgi:hypothetical protein